MERLIPGILLTVIAALLLTVIAVLLIVLATRDTGGQFGDNGRYQLMGFQGSEGVWRIDTRTGDVSGCGGASISYRISFPEYRGRSGCIRFPELEPPQ